MGLGRDKLRSRSCSNNKPKLRLAITRLLRHQLPAPTGLVALTWRGRMIVPANHHTSDDKRHFARPLPSTIPIDTDQLSK